MAAGGKEGWWGESRFLELTYFGHFVDVQLKTLRGHVAIPKSYSYGGPCPGFEPKSECFRALGWLHEIRLMVADPEGQIQVWFPWSEHAFTLFHL